MIDVREVYPYLRVHDAAEAIEFYARAFGARDLFRLTEPSGRIGHAELKLGPATLMLSDEHPQSAFAGRARSVEPPSRCICTSRTSTPSSSRR